MKNSILLWDILCITQLVRYANIPTKFYLEREVGFGVKLEFHNINIRPFIICHPYILVQGENN